MPNKASGMPKYHIKPRNHQEQFRNEIWHFESVCDSHDSSSIDDEGSNSGSSSSSSSGDSDFSTTSSEDRRDAIRCQRIMLLQFENSILTDLNICTD